MDSERIVEDYGTFRLHIDRGNIKVLIYKSERTKDGSRFKDVFVADDEDDIIRGIIANKICGEAQRRIEENRENNRENARKTKNGMNIDLYQSSNILGANENFYIEVNKILEEYGLAESYEGHILQILKSNGHYEKINPSPSLRKLFVEGDKDLQKAVLRYFARAKGFDIDNLTIVATPTNIKIDYTTKPIVRKLTGTITQLNQEEKEEIIKEMEARNSFLSTVKTTFDNMIKKAGETAKRVLDSFGNLTTKNQSTTTKQEDAIPQFGTASPKNADNEIPQFNVTANKRANIFPNDDIPQFAATAPEKPQEPKKQEEKPANETPKPKGIIRDFIDRRKLAKTVKAGLSEEEIKAYIKAAEEMGDEDSLKRWTNILDASLGKPLTYPEYENARMTSPEEPKVQEKPAKPVSSADEMQEKLAEVDRLINEYEGDEVTVARLKEIRDFMISSTNKKAEPIVNDTTSQEPNQEPVIKTSSNPKDASSAHPEIGIGGINFDDVIKELSTAIENNNTEEIASQMAKLSMRFSYPVTRLYVKELKDALAKDDTRSINSALRCLSYSLPGREDKLTFERIIGELAKSISSKDKQDFDALVGFIKEKFPSHVTDIYLDKLNIAIQNDDVKAIGTCLDCLSYTQPGFESELAKLEQKYYLEYQKSSNIA